MITQFGYKVFECNAKGLDGIQWAMAIGVGLTSFIIDFLVKFLPDWLFPKLGKDSVDDRRAAAAALAK